MRLLQRMAHHLGAVLMAGCLGSGSALAQAPYPNHPIELIIGFPPGTVVDTLARLYASNLQMGQPVVVKAMSGAAGNIAARAVAKANPDGYTLLLAGNASIVTNQSLYESLPYDPEKDLVPVSQLAMAPNVLVIHPDVPAQTVQELAAYARARPDALSYAHAGLGISQHLAAELFKQMAGIEILAVGYRGGPDIYSDLLAGRVKICFCNIVSAMPFVREGKLRALAVTSTSRSVAASDLPTMHESGFPGFEAVAWFGLMVPAGTPPSIVETLHRETVRVLAAEELRAKFAALGMTPIGNSPTEFTAAIKSEIPYWNRVIKTLGLKLQ
jgi:tripartite-type tricarboxylate transporter receptor subunit TctC